MFFQPDVMTPFTTGAAAGLGHVFGQRFLPWLLTGWRWLLGKSPAPGASTGSPNLLHNAMGDSLIKKVSLADVAGGIPENYVLCRFQGNSLREKHVATTPKELAADETLWLVPAGEVVIRAAFPTGEGTAEAEVAVQFEPDDGLSGLLADGSELDRGWLGSLVAGSLLGVLTMWGKQSGKALVAGDPAAADGCRQRLDQALHARGLRCRSIRPIGESKDAGSGMDDAAFQELAREVGQVRSSTDWEHVVGGLKGAGVPIDPIAAKELDRIRDEVIQKAIQPEQAVTGLARMTIQAFERAGIEQPDLQRWATISERLSDDYSGANATDIAAVAAVPVGVATTRRPGTWHVWSRVEVDRRLMQYTKRTVNHCRVACEQALASLRDIATLRQVRDLKANLDVIDSLLSTMPPLDPKNSSLRIDAHTAKGLVRSLEEAVLVTESLAKQSDQLFAQAPATTGWQDNYQNCLRSVSKLTQLVRDRRNVR